MQWKNVLKEERNILGGGRQHPPKKVFEAVVGFTLDFDICLALLLPNLRNLCGLVAEGE